MTQPGLGTPFQRSLGLRWSSLADGVSVSLDPHDDVRGPAGSVEGGVVSTLVDVAGASAAAAATGRLVATQHMAVSFIAPGRAGPIRADGRTLRVGRTDVVTEVRVVDEGNDGRLIAVALVTLKIIGALPDRS
jgi:uncharacterized protein (TIGR00369 family)